jgi:hypothetical protein
MLHMARPIQFNSRQQTNHEALERKGLETIDLCSLLHGISLGLSMPM